MPSPAKLVLINLAIVAFLAFQYLHNHVSLPYVLLMALVLFAIGNVGMWLSARAQLARQLH